jgi:hypothetical protein
MDKALKRRRIDVKQSYHRRFALHLAVSVLPAQVNEKALPSGKFDGYLQPLSNISNGRLIYHNIINKLKACYLL